MTGALSFYRTSIGKKAVMAVTGVILFGFVVGHMIGNLSIYAGREAINSYAAFLKSTGELLWVARGVLLLSVILHIVSAVQLTVENRASRPGRYAFQKTIQASFASRTMRWGGLMLFFFIIYHLGHFTAGAVPGTGTHSPTDVYQNVINGFSYPLVALFYILAMIALGMHLYHGAWSMFQTLGLNSNRFNTGLRRFATLAAAALMLGNISIPVAVLTGFLK
ncbi:MAG TPA: succinate dehydrogenase cytochrome b subunit [Herpetosiphonaceae bacterium]